MVFDAVAAALASTGHDVVDIGIATTPTTEMAVQESDAVGGVIITASHNPQQWNALKFLQTDGLFLTAAQNREVRQRYEDQSGHVAWDRLGRVRGETGADERHLAALLKPCPGWIRRGSARAACTWWWTRWRGPAAPSCRALLEALGVRCTPLNCGLTGNFPHDPEPTPAHLADLCAEVKRQRGGPGPGRGSGRGPAGPGGRHGHAP